MGNNQSLDPRIQRLDLPSNTDKKAILGIGDNWGIFEVFHLKKRGDHHMHVGSIHAPNEAMALVFAKEQYGRRKKCINLWVVKTPDIVSFPLEDEDMFYAAVSPEKKYRDASGFKVSDKIKEFKTRKANTV